MHEGECRAPVGQRNSTCSFCFCESSLSVPGTGIVACWLCTFAIIKEHWNAEVNPEACARSTDGKCSTHCPED